jgi:hypothetical protein
VNDKEADEARDALYPGRSARRICDHTRVD